jgi:hypothetical protein
MIPKSAFFRVQPFNYRTNSGGRTRRGRRSGSRPIRRIWSSSYAWEQHGLGGRETAVVVRLPGGVPVNLLESIVLLRDLVRMTILWHQVTSSCHLMGIGIRVWHGFGVAVGSMFMVRGGPDIMGRVWCSHTLKQLAA